MRNITIKFCAMLLVFCTSAIHLQAMDEWDGVTIAKGFYSGTGTKADPYRIFTASQFLYFIQQIKDGNTFSDKYIELCNDIAFNHESVEGGNFYGDFDGNDHIIQVNSFFGSRDDGYIGWTLFNLYGSMHDVQFIRANEVMRIYTGGILYNCRFEYPNGSYHGWWTVYLEGGTIANCVSNSAHFQNGSKYGGSLGLVYGNESSSHCSNCYFPITSYSYGGTLAENYYGIIESCGEEAGNDWIQSHTERAYKSWPLTFNPTYPDYNVTITFVDEYGFVSYDAKSYLANSTIGELPIPDVDNTFLGWKCNGKYVQSTDVITHDMVLYADWKHEIKVQPTIYEPSVFSNDKEHANYQWYYQERMPIFFEDITNSTSTQTKYIEVSDDDVILSFDFEAHGYEYSGNYRDYEREAWISVNGETIVSVYSEKKGSYSCPVSTGTYKISCERSDISNIRISCPTVTLENETSSALSKQTIMNSPGAYFCKVTYSNNGDELISDFVDYEKLLTIDDVTYVINEDATATVLWVADKAVDITIPETVYYDGVNYPVTSISSKAFVDCTSLASIKCKTLDVPALLGNTTFEGLNTSNVTLHVPAASIESYKATEPWRGFRTIYAISTEVDGINYDFDSETNQATVIAKSSGGYLSEVVIPESVEYGGTTYSVTSIGDWAFSGCTGLTSVTIGNSVTSIGEEAFSDCSGLTSVTIGNSVTSIGNKAFFNCSGLTSVTIGSGVTSLGLMAFDGCYGLTSVTIPNSVTSIGERAFRKCSGLTSVTIPNSVTSIGSLAFCDCSGLTSVTIGNSVTSIGSYAFDSCSGLTSVTIPNSVKSIGSGAFEYCSGLTSIVVEDENPVYDSRNNCNAIIETTTNTLHSGCQTTIIPNSVTSIGDMAFDGCSGLTSVTIPNSVKSIGDYAFSGCSGLTSVTIPNSVTSIGDYAFYDCSGLTSVTIGSGVKNIYTLVFANCSDLFEVYCYAENVPSTESDAFDGSYPKNPTLHVPAASINSYKATEPWRSFGNIVAISESTSDLVIKDGDGESFENTEERELGTLTYTRTLPNRYWNPLYVPFKIPYETLKDNYDVAYVNSIHSYDNDEDGQIDKLTMEVVKIKDGTLKANHPYLIRAKDEDSRAMNLVLKNTTLCATKCDTLDCSSVYIKYEITGTYSTMTSAALDGSLVITTSGAWQRLSPSSSLRPFRFYLTITPRGGSPVELEESALSRINICVQGEDDFSTGIEETENGKVKSENSAVYDLSGRRVKVPTKGGVYIVNGKKVVF